MAHQELDANSDANRFTFDHTGAGGSRRISEMAGLSRCFHGRLAPAGLARACDLGATRCEL